MLFKRMILASVTLTLSVSAQAQVQYPSYPAANPRAPAANQAIPAPATPVADPLAQPVPQMQVAQAPATIGATPRNRLPAELKPLGLEQKAWSNPQKAMGPRQTMPGFLRVNWRPDTVTTINTREGMLTVIRWPISEKIINRQLSDAKTFESAIGPDGRSIVLRSVFAGVDGNMVVYGQSGNVYNIYLRSLAVDSSQLPDTTVEMIVGGLNNDYGGTLRSTAPASAPYNDYKDLYKPAVTRKVEEFNAGSREWAHANPASGKDMKTNIDIMVPSREDQVIAPIRAWHDGKFTYMDFGPNASSMNQWPVAALLVDGSETPVGTRTTGSNGSLMIVEAIGNIVLRNGRHLVCLKLRNQPDNRVSPSTIPARANNLPTAKNVVRITASGTQMAKPKPTKKAQTPVSKGNDGKVETVTTTVVNPVKASHMTPAEQRFKFDTSSFTGKIH